MLKKESYSRTILDKNLLAEIGELNRSQLKLAKDQGVATSIQKLAAKVVELSEEDGIRSAVVFLTEKKCNPALQKVLDWLGVDQNLDDPMIFGGKLTGTFDLGEQLFKMQLFHFDHYPVRIFPECHKALNIVVFDTGYRAKYPNWDLAFQVLGMNPSVCLLVDLSEASDSGFPDIPTIKSVHSKYIPIEKLGSSVHQVLAEADLVQGVQVAKTLNHLQCSEYVLGRIANDLADMEKRWQGKAMLTYKKEQQLHDKAADRPEREMGELKVKIGSGYKQLIGYAEGKIDTLDRTNPEYRKLEEEITSFLGFVETKGSRYLTLKISEGAVQDKMQKANALLSDFFGNLTEEVNKGIATVEGDIKARFRDWQLDPPDIDTPPIDQGFTQEVLGLSPALPDKPYEKQIMAKGFGSLLMELRTPLFMLMPFMMIFALFASLVGEDDTGHIDETVLFHDNRPVIAVDQLPESRDNEFGRFIDELEGHNAPGKGVFEKGIEGELATEPQLAVQLIEVPQTYGNTTKTEQQLDYFYDNKAQTVYLYLNPNADRNFVIDKLYDPDLELLTIPASTRRGFGIGGLIRILSSLSDYRYIIFTGLLALISWFVITRKRSMDAELASAKAKERAKLNSDLRQHVDKTVKGNIQRWRTKLVDELNARENTLLKKTERTLGRNVENQRRQKLQEKKSIQKRTATLKLEKTKLSNFKSELRKLRSKYDLVQTKLKRALR